MKYKTHSTLVSAVLISLLTGCSKEAEVPAPSPEVAPAVQQAQPAPAAAIPSAPDGRLTESQAALKARDYDKAAEALIALQRAKLNEQQAALAAAQMRQLQSSLADALASGDPRAKAAADRLRQSAMSR